MADLGVDYMTVDKNTKAISWSSYSQTGLTSDPIGKVAGLVFSDFVVKLRQMEDTPYTIGKVAGLVFSDYLVKLGQNEVTSNTIGKVAGFVLSDYLVKNP